MAAAAGAGDAKADRPKEKKPTSDVKTWNVKCKISPSLLPNNLSSSGGGYLCYTSRNERDSRNEVHVVKESADDIVNERPCAQPLITVLPDRDTIAQAKYARMTAVGGDVLVVVTHTGVVNVYDDSGQKLLQFHKLTRSSTDAKTVKELHLQGIANDQTGRIFVGAGNGEFIVFSITKQKFALTKKYAAHKEPVTDLSYFETGTPVAPGGVLVTGDQSGAVAVWDDVKEVITKVAEFPGAGQPVTSIRTGHGFAVVAYASGHIRLIDLKTKKMAVEIAAHVRCISAVDIHPTKPLFAATSEDTYTSIWTLPVATNKKIKNVMCASLGHSLFTGLQFCGKYGGSTATSALPASAIAAALSATGAAGPLPITSGAPSAPQVTLSTSNLLCVVGLDTKYCHFMPLPADK